MSQVSRRHSAERFPPGRTVAVTAIEHRDSVITVASLVRKPELLPSAQTEGAFETIILGGPLCGETRESETWSMMIRDHVGAVTRVAELVAAETRGDT